jgi:hypothetical protein
MAATRARSSVVGSEQKKKAESDGVWHVLVANGTGLSMNAVLASGWGRVRRTPRCNTVNSKRYLMI